MYGLPQGVMTQSKHKAQNTDAICGGLILIEKIRKIYVVKKVSNEKWLIKIIQNVESIFHTLRAVTHR